MISSYEERRSNAVASGTTAKAFTANERRDTCQKYSDDDDDGEWRDENGGEKKQNRRKRKSPANTNNEPRLEGHRKSRRLKGEKAEFTSTGNGSSEEEFLFSKDPAVRKREREECVDECREVRLRAANAIAACGGEEAAKKNPTATYEHCLMRVKTMTEKGLLNRVKAIERAAGKHCVVKMAIFKSCLQDEGRWELAGVASDALERLKALKPIPEE